MLSNHVTRTRSTRPLLFAMMCTGIIGATLMMPGPTAQAAAGSTPSLVWTRTTPQGFDESSPMAVNLDGQNDVVDGNLDGNLWAVHGSDGSSVSGFPVQLGTGIDSSPSAADVTGSGRPTIFVGTGTPSARGGDFYSISSGGGINWKFHPSDNDFPSLSMFSSPAIADVNGDGKADVSAFSLGLLGWSLNSDGSMNKGWPFYQDDTVFSSPALYDLNGDGVPEYIVGGDSSPGGPVDHRGGFIRALTGNGTLLWSFPTDEMIRSSPVVGDIDGNGQPSIAFGTGDYWVKQPGGATDSTKLTVLNKDGSLKWQRDLGAYTDAAPVLADVNGDGKLDVVIGTFNGSNPGKVWAFDGNGNPLSGWAGRDSGGGVVLGQISTADLNNDGAQDLLVPTGAGVFAYDGRTANPLFSLNTGLASYQNAPLVTDIDGNGKLDIIIAGTKPDGTGEIQRFQMPDTTARLGANGWPQFRKDNVHSGSEYGYPVYRDYCSSSPGQGYWMAASDGGLFAYCNATFYGSMGGQRLVAPIVGMSGTADKRGYWEVASDGGIFAFGDAAFRGSAGGVRLASPVVGMARTPDGGGYWEVAADGGIFAYGNARFFGSMGGQHLNSPIVGMAATPTGNGYWLVAADGGVFAYGDAAFFGSMGGSHLNQPIVGMASTNDGRGYWFVASDGGIFAYGDAGFFGSTGAIKLNQPVVGMAANANGGGYRLVAADGGIFAYNSPFLGSTGAININKPIITMAVSG